LKSLPYDWVAAKADLRYSLEWETAAAASAQRFSAELESLDLKSSKSHLLIQWFYPVHPGIAKQVMEPATLWFERRVRKVQTCDKRQTLSPVRRTGSKGGEYPPFLYELIYE
jgi:hypothetical protein